MKLLEVSESGMIHQHQGQKRDKATENVSDEIDNRCCICFGTYSDDTGTSREWLMCSYNRWVHEDCIDLDDVDDSDRVCPLH